MTLQASAKYCQKKRKKGKDSKKLSILEKKKMQNEKI